MTRAWFCDMDGVLVKQTGQSRFDEMPWHPNGKAIWQALVGLRPTLLSFSVDGCTAQTYFEKRVWVDFHLGSSVPMIVVPKTTGKWPYCTPRAVLIDDSEDNCKRWRQAGGEPVLVRDSLPDVLALIGKLRRS
jgi:hypothetical protein